MRREEESDGVIKDGASREKGTSSLLLLLEGDFFSIFNLASLLSSCSLSLLVSVSIFFPCVCVACAPWCFPSFVSLPFISTFYRFSLSFSVSLSLALWRYKLFIL